MSNWLGALVERRPWSVAALVVALSVLAGYALRLPVERTPLGQDDAAWQRLGFVEREFNLSAGAVLVAEAPDVFAADAVEALARVAQALGALDSVDTLLTPDLVPPSGSAGKPWPARGANDVERAAARTAAHAHPLVAGWLVAADDRTLALPLVWDRSGSHAGPGPWAADLIGVARDAAGAGLSLRLTGPGPMLAAQNRAFSRDYDRFRLIAVAVVAVLAAFLFRSFGAVLVAGAAPLVGVFWALGSMRLFGLEASGYTRVVLPILLAMIGFTDSVHVCMHIRAQRAAGVRSRAAARDALTHFAWPCLLTSLTTAIGFGSLARASSPTVSNFGIGCALGTLCAFVAVMTVTPLLSMTFLGRHLGRAHGRDLPGRAPGLYERPLRVILRRPILIALCGVFATGGLAWAAGGLRADNRLALDLPADSEAYAALEHCDAAFGGAYPVVVHVAWDADVPAATWIQAVEQAQVIVSEEELCAAPLSVVALLDLTPAFGSRAARLPLLSLAPAGLIGQLYRPDLREALVLTRVQDLGIARYGSVYDELDRRLAAVEPPGVSLTLTGGPVLYGRYVSVLIGELAQSLVLAAGIILVVLGLAFRSWRLGVASIVPNLFPLAVTAGLLVALGGRLEIAYVTAFTLCLGIAVDDTVHVMVRYRRARLAGLAPEDATRDAVGGVASALWATTIIMVAGFGTLITSPIPANQAFGWMAATTLAAAWVADMLLLPAFLVVCDRRR